MKESQYILSGFFSPSDIIPSFVVPVFRHKGQLFLQETDETDNVAHLRLIERSRFPYPVQHLNSGIRISQRSAAVYGFAFGRREFIFKTKYELTNVLKGRLDELTPHPFIYIDVLNFIGDMEGLRSAIYRIQNVMAFRNKEIASQLTNIQLSIHNLNPASKEESNWITDTLKSADSQGYINYWDVFDELSNLIELYGCVYVKCKLVRSVIGTNPKTRNTIRSLGFHSTRIGQISSEFPVDLNNLHSLRTISTHVLVSEARIYAENEIAIMACDTVAIQKRYFKKDLSKIVKGKQHKDYLFQIVQPDPAKDR
jgi:hypothetical protein